MWSFAEVWGNELTYKVQVYKYMDERAMSYCYTFCYETLSAQVLCIPTLEYQVIELKTYFKGNK